MTFSARTRFELDESALSRTLADARRAGAADLTESNPTRCGLASPEAVALLGHPRGAGYSPDPMGEAGAREAIAGDLTRRGHVVDPSRVILSASTSEAYGWLFKLLADPGDAVLVPQPSYPLFEWLARLEGVRLVPYPLVREENFRLDVGAIAPLVDDRTRAILLVHPNNPTGTFVRRADAEALEALCEARGLSLVVDEVFADYPHGALREDRLPSFVGRRRVPTFVLSGLSKVLALPQLKLGWTIVDGPEAQVRDALARLELIADTYLSVSTPVQRALPELLALRDEVQGRLRARLAENLRAIDAACAGSPVRRLPSDGGWTAILEGPLTREDTAWVELLAAEASVLVQPGWFYDLDREGFLVVSLLPDPATFAPAIARAVARIAAG
ncbi:MAG: pyridoxal phosphate-dependent aminotransferase [Myxococcales bacterium]|nr:pyridoxal phosphate-dependent aminotransferase [Myxococcales bacterium]